MSGSKTKRKAQSDLANAVKKARRDAADPQAANEVVEARRGFAAAKLEAYIAEVMAQAPELTQAQKAKLAVMLLPGLGGS